MHYPPKHKQLINYHPLSLLPVHCGRAPVVVVHIPPLPLPLHRKDVASNPQAFSASTSSLRRPRPLPAGHTTPDFRSIPRQLLPAGGLARISIPLIVLS